LPRNERAQKAFAQLRQAPQVLQPFALEGQGFGLGGGGLGQLRLGAGQRFGELAHERELALAQDALDQLTDAGFRLVEVAALAGAPALLDRTPLHQLAERHADGTRAHLQLGADLGRPQRLG
jgi:hypothetical protein